MSGLYKIVRPFQTRDISPPKPIGAGTGTDTATSNPDDAVTVEYGRSWQVKTLHGNITIDETFYTIKKMRERPKET